MSVSDLRQSYERTSCWKARPALRRWNSFPAGSTRPRPPRCPNNAMTLATVDASGQPSARIVLIRATMSAASPFHQLRIAQGHGPAGRAARLPAVLLAAAGTPGAHRGRGGKGRGRGIRRLLPQPARRLGIGAWASRQSQPITREELEAREQEFRARYGDQPPRPPHWGGYRLKPTAFEFWQGRPSRLHDRLRYVPTAPAGRSNAYRRRGPERCALPEGAAADRRSRIRAAPIRWRRRELT